MQTDFKKMTETSLRGPKRPQECLLRLTYIVLSNFALTDIILLANWDT